MNAIVIEDTIRIPSRRWAAKVDLPERGRISWVLGKSFRLLRSRDELGNPEYTVAVR